MNLKDSKIEQKPLHMNRHATLMHDSLRYSQALATIFRDLTANGSTPPQQDRKQRE